jgi:ABC-type nickel/cobalt efflux system permease component RcnA
MRRAVLILAAVLVVSLAAFWALGGIGALASWAEAGQRSFQTSMAQALRALRASEPGALAALMGVAFGYGFFHAVGPGHGKVLIGGYGLGARVAARRLMGIALVASLAQAASAVALVYGGIWAFGWSRQTMTGFAEGGMEAASYGAIVLIGGWLLWRGGRRLWRMGQAARVHRHGHDHASEVCESCGHRHLPGAEEVARVRSWRDALAIVAGIAIRPCTGALFLLILTWRMGIGPAGVAGAFVMALGTASVTVAVALLATGLRESTLTGLSGSRFGQMVAPGLELAAGALVIAVAAPLFAHAL